jgi:hypothetical protein
MTPAHSSPRMWDRTWIALPETAHHLAEETGKFRRIIGSTGDCGAVTIATSAVALQAIASGLP